MNTIYVALVGNPNCGKSTLFNQLTGSDQRVGNWPGVTVECKSGQFEWMEQQIEVIDLPGTYGLNLAGLDSSLDESIACDYILQGRADIIINIVDACNLERNLYLTDQLLSLGRPIIVALNMIDVAKQQGITVCEEALSRELGCPVIPIIANKNHGINDLRTSVVNFLDAEIQNQYFLELPRPLAKAVDEIALEMQRQDNPQTKSTTNNVDNEYWQMSLRLFENDNLITQQMDTPFLEKLNQQRNDVEAELKEETDILIADARYQTAHEICKKTTKIRTPKHVNMTRLIDRFVLNRLLGIPIFLCVMYALFVFAINVGGIFQDFFDLSSNTIFVDGLSYIFNEIQAPTWATPVLAEGFGKGLSTILTFIPVIFCMFLFLSALEDSGYMARAAFVMDRFMRALGLPGRSFVPMIIGFGCNVPAVMATRTLDNHRDRILTTMMTPFMSCGARLAIYAVFTAAFFKTGGHNVIFSLYLIGLCAAILTGLLLRKTFLPGPSSPMVMELPTYHRPQLRMLLKHAFNRTRSFLNRAGRVIIPVCIVISLLNSLDMNGHWIQNKTEDKSVIAHIGKAITPVFHPMGIEQENWPATVGLISGILAKEVVVGTLNTLYHQDGSSQDTTLDTEAFNLKEQLDKANNSVRDNVRAVAYSFVHPLSTHLATPDVNQRIYGVMHQRFNGQLGAFAFLLFILLYFPCVSTLVVMSKEIGKSWAWFSVTWSTGLAYGAAVLVYQVGRYTENPLSAKFTIGVILFCMVSAFLAVRLRLGYAPSMNQDTAGNSS